MKDDHKFPSICIRSFKTKSKSVLNRYNIISVNLPNINSFPIKLTEGNSNTSTIKPKNLNSINETEINNDDTIKTRKRTLNNEGRKFGLLYDSNKYKSINSSNYSLDYKIIRFLNSNKNYKNTITKNNLISPNFLSVEHKLRQKYLNIAKENNNKKSITEKCEEIPGKNISENSSFSEGDEQNFQKNIAQKILSDDRNKQKKRISSNYIKRKELDFFDKFEIDKKKLNKLIINYSNNMVQSNVSLNEFIKDYNKHFIKKELYNNQLIRMNSLRGKNFQKVKKMRKEINEEN